MDIYANTLTLLERVPIIQKWPEMEGILRRFVTRHPRDWELPVLVCEAVGGSRKQAQPAVEAIGCLQISIMLIDDLLDKELDDQLQQMGEAAVANLAAAFQAAGIAAITHSQAKPSVQLAILDSLNQMFLTTAFGQHWDCQNPADEETYWQVVENKSAPFYGTTLHVGALVGGASPEVAYQIKQFGCLYGEMIQIHDDLNDSMAIPANPDWLQGRSPLPILFAQVVEHPDRARFLTLRQSISDPAALAEAQAILQRSGAVSYCIDQLLHRYKKACHKLAAIPLVERSGLEKLLEEQVQPVWSLFQSMGIEQPQRLALAA